MKDNSRKRIVEYNPTDRREEGVALVVAIIIVAILSVVALTALAFSSNETRIAGNELERMQAHYAAQSGLEKMTKDFSDLFRRKMRPTADDLTLIKNSPPTGLDFTFNQTLEEDATLLAEYRRIQSLGPTEYPTITIPEGPYAGLSASLIPYKISSTATRGWSKAQVQLERNFNNYLIPLFQFGLFSNDDLQFHPGPMMTFNGRIHSNRNLYALQNVVFLDKVTVAGEFVRDVWKKGNAAGGGNVTFRINGIDVSSSIGMGSVKAGSGFPGGPNLPGSTSGTRGYYRDSPSGVINGAFDTTSVRPVLAGAPDRFGGWLLTGTTGAKPLKLPLEMDGSNPAELIKRALPSDGALLSSSRYHNKASIRVLIDDKDAGSGIANVAGIPAGKGLLLHEFEPIPLNGNGGNDVLKRFTNTGIDPTSATVLQENRDGTTTAATTVRAIKAADNLGTDAATIPRGSGLEGRIYIEVVKPDGTTIDVTQTILSMGVTEGEPNGIFYLQRPIWAGFVQGSRDRLNTSIDLVNLTSTQKIADGEMVGPTIDTANFHDNRGFLKKFVDDDSSGYIRLRKPPDDLFNKIVPIQVYNVREGWYISDVNDSSSKRWSVWDERGLTSVVEINMKNLVRWLDGVYDTNLLAGTNAVSTNIREDAGYVVYISDRRGDNRKTEYAPDGTTYQSTNGIVDNEDIYGPNGQLDPGEDVIDFGRDALKGGASKAGTLQKDTNELPDTGHHVLGSNTESFTQKLDRAVKVQKDVDVKRFRRAVRIFNGDVLSTTAAAGKLSPTKGISIATENMLYTWGNVNSTGVASIPANGSTLNNGGYLGPQVPISLVCDAYFPLSKTWFDASSSAFPGQNSSRLADEGITTTNNVGQSTTVRTALIAGATRAEMNGFPGRNPDNERSDGGIQNFPRFLEVWGSNVPFNFSGSIAPLYHSTQAVAQWETDYDGSVIYSPPRRNWSFDATFLNPNRLPPGTPLFQYTSATAFRQKLF